MQQSEQELSLKKRARRRLVGALALVLLMVIFLPMLLKNPAISTAPDEAIKITLTQKSVTQDEKQAEEVEVTTENLPKPALETPVQTPNITEEKAKVETPAIAEKKQPDAAKLADQPIKNSHEPATNNAQKFYVQIGVFSEMPNVKQLQSKLTDLGYSSSTEKINTDKGTKIRLRTKTFDNRNEAAIALENIKDAGLTGMVVSQ